MTNPTKLFFASAILIIFAVAVCNYDNKTAAQQERSNTQETARPANANSQHDASHQQGVNKRGDMVMGFSHMKATHHFILKTDGGVIDVSANDPKDTETRNQIRGHLTHIAKMFAEGNFNAPMLIHAQTPPGVPTLQKLKSEIKYTFEQTEHGARILIKTNNSEALAAIHDFLRFQIEDHKTGDSKEVGN